MHKVFIVIGTRPEAIKMALLIKLIKEDPKLELILCHTGQHHVLIQNVLELFDIKPDIRLNAISHNKSLDIQHAYLIKMIGKELKQLKPDLVLVQGDTLSCFTGALAAFHNKIPIAHVEAGLRTHIKNSPFPEELYRTMVDQMSDILFPPTLKSSHNLKSLKNRQLLVTGNTGIDALFYINKKLDKKEILIKEHLTKLNASIKRNKNKMVLLTLHRREIHGEILESILDEVLDFVNENQVEILVPMHKNPVVRKTLKSKFKAGGKVHLLESMDYFEFIWAMKNSLFVISDSGGVQEEAPSLGKRVVVVREETERMEATRKFNIIAGTKRKKIKRALHKALKEPKVNKTNFFGDGKASIRIVNFLKLYFNK